MSLKKIKDEKLEIWDWDSARPTGKAVSRKTVHQKGIPHEAVHLWIMRPRNNAMDLLFQQRAPHKENYPDCLDISVGGHVPFGLQEGKVLKEAEEEIGIDLDEKELIDLGWYRYEEKSDSLYQREFQHVFLLADSRGLERYSFRDGEVTGIYAVPVQKLQALFEKDFSFDIEGFDGETATSRTVSRRDFHPQLFDESMEAYMKILLAAVSEYTASGTVSIQMI